MMDGNIVYQGLAKDSIRYFGEMGLQCRLHTNPADYYMRILTVNYPKSEEDDKHIQDLIDHY